MPYVAHVGIVLDCDYTSYEKEKWYTSFNQGGIEIRWRLRNDLLYEIIAGPFSDRFTALKIAKYLIVTTLLNCLYEDIPILNAGLKRYEHRLFDPQHDPFAHTLEEFMDTEAFFFWNPNYIGDGLGVGVYEIPTMFLNSFNVYDHNVSYKKSAVHIFSDEQKLDFKNLGGVYFSYTREVREIFLDIFSAENTTNYGYKAIKYCGILERLSLPREKEQEVVSIIEQLISIVKSANLSDSQKDSLCNYLNSGKQISSSQKCSILIQEYAKEKYDEYSPETLLKTAYSLRSKYSHGNNCDNKYCDEVDYLKYVVLDVINKYFHDKETANA